MTRQLRALRARHLKALGLGIFVLALGACASGGGNLRQARLAEQAQDYDLAVAEYTKAARSRPDDRTIRLSLDRAKLRASQDHFARARRHAATGKTNEALVEYQLASELNPGNADIQDELRTLRAQMRTQVALDRGGKTTIEALIKDSLAAPLPGADVPPDVTLPDSLIFREAGARDIFTAIGKFANMSVVFDPAFRDQTLSIDLRKAPLADALSAVGTATRHFWRVTAPRTVTVVPDTAAKRREYEEEIVRTFFLSNADLKETVDVLRIVVDARRLAPVAATNAITIKDTPERVAAAGRIIQAIDKARPEVVIDVELLEVDRTRFKQYGIQILSPGSDVGIAGQVDINQEGGLTLEQLTNLGKGDVFFTNLPGLYYRLLKQDSDTRTLANPQLRTSDGLPAQAKFGEEVPVPQVTFAPIAQGGVNQQPITSFTYRNVGVNIDITPRTHHNDDVTLGVKIEVSALSGTGYSGLPTFATRSITTTIRLRDGETNLLAGLIRDNERTVLKGLPGLSDVPVLGRIFSSNERETQQTDVIVMLTPRIIRVLDLDEDDLRPFLAGRSGGPSTGAFDVTPTVTPLPLRQPQSQPDADGPGTQFPQLPSIPEQRPLPAPRPTPIPPTPPK
jgi:general secretion pathway protein D